jgi:hypothetical protein
METAVFKKYEDGYYTFLFDQGEEMVFEEVSPRVLYQFDLKNDKSLIDKTFELSFIEVFDDDDEDFLIYRIEYLKLV